MSRPEISQEDKKILNKCYYYSLNTYMCFNNVVMQGKAFGMSVLPAIQAYYKTEEEKRKAFARNANEVFNSHGVMHGLIAGIVAAMEKERAEKGNIDEKAISSLKASLMGPLAGIGDSFFFNCYRVIIAGICIGLASDGNALAPILFLLLYGGGLLAIKYVFLIEGFRYGAKLVSEAFERGIIPMIMDAGGIVGAIMVGTLVASNVKIKIALEPIINGATISVQGILDSVMPGILSLILWWIVFKWIRKGITPTKMIFIIIGSCLVLAFFGVFA